MDIQDKVAILRQYETYCYQICYFLIEDEKLATEAARNALLGVARESGFFIETIDRQKKKIRSVAIHASLNTKLIANRAICQSER